MNEKCCILVPALAGIEPECERGLRELGRRGYKVRVLRGATCIDQVRSLMATEALAEGFEDLMWIDSDIGFEPDDVDKLRAHPHPFVCGLYTKKGAPEFAHRLPPSVTQVVLGEGGGLVPVAYAAMGFTLTRAEVYRKLDREFVDYGMEDIGFDLAMCRGYHGRPMRPYFLPVVQRDMWPPGETLYLGEDYAFSWKARQVIGMDIYADTTIRLYHVGRYAYSWEDLAPVQRVAGVTVEVGPAQKPETPPGPAQREA